MSLEAQMKAILSQLEDRDQILTLKFENHLTKVEAEMKSLETQLRDKEEIITLKLENKIKELSHNLEHRVDSLDGIKKIPPPQPSLD